MKPSVMRSLARAAVAWMLVKTNGAATAPSRKRRRETLVRDMRVSCVGDDRVGNPSLPTCQQNTRRERGMHAVFGERGTIVPRGVYVTSTGDYRPPLARSQCFGLCGSSRRAV